jgi:hypothetical protein
MSPHHVREAEVGSRGGDAEVRVQQVEVAAKRAQALAPVPGEHVLDVAVQVVNLRKQTL